MKNYEEHKKNSTRKKKFLLKKSIQLNFAFNLKQK